MPRVRVDIPPLSLSHQRHKRNHNVKDLKRWKTDPPITFHKCAVISTNFSVIFEFNRLILCVRVRFSSFLSIPFVSVRLTLTSITVYLRFFSLRIVFWLITWSQSQNVKFLFKSNLILCAHHKRWWSIQHSRGISNQTHMTNIDFNSTNKIEKKATRFAKSKAKNLQEVN